MFSIKCVSFRADQKSKMASSLWVHANFSASSLELLNRIRRNLTGGKNSTSFTKFFFFGAIFISICSIPKRGPKMHDCCPLGLLLKITDSRSTQLTNYDRLFVLYISAGCPWVRNGQITRDIYDTKKSWCPVSSDGCPKEAFLSSQLYKCTFLVPSWEHYISSRKDINFMDIQFHLISSELWPSGYNVRLVILRPCGVGGSNPTAEKILCNGHLFRARRSWTGGVQMNSSMTSIRGNRCIEREKDNFKSREVKRLKECALALK